MFNIEWAAASHPGLIRELNEDSYLVLPESGVWAIADGMGGHESGEVASSIAVWELAYHGKAGVSLAESINAANHAIHDATAHGIGNIGMGSTVVAVKIAKKHFQIAWIGDSRAYLLSQSFTQLTQDHSYVQLLLKAGVINESQVADHPYRNIISQALGSDTIKPEFIEGILNTGDVLLLCTDGLSNELSASQIAATLSSEDSLQAQANQLIDDAIAAGGNDNVTVLLIKCI